MTANLLALSDERDVHLALRHRAYREGYMEGSGEQWSAGYAAAVADVKRAQHDAPSRRLAPGGAAMAGQRRAQRRHRVRRRR